MPKVSVVVPIYNASDYLRQALDSLVNQTLRDIEIICVNDGSTDDSLEIIKEYAARDSRFVVVDKPNAGYGHSMNCGLRHATGEYLGILEPDDFIELNAFENLCSTARDSSLLEKAGSAPIDIVRSGFYYYTDAMEYRPAKRIKSGVGSKLSGQRSLLSKDEAAEFLMSHPSIWSAIYRLDFLRDNGISFIEAPGAGWVDNPFLYETICKAETVAWDPHYYYNYRVSNEGASSYLKDYTIPLDRLGDISAFLEKEGIADKSVVDSYIRRTIDYSLSLINGLDPSLHKPDMYERIRRLFEELDCEKVMQCELVGDGSKRFYKDLTGRSLSRLKKMAPCENPKLTFVVPSSNNAKYIYEMLSEILKHEDVPVDVVCVRHGDSYDCTNWFLNEISGADGRVSVVDSAKEDWIRHVRAPFAVFCGENRTVRLDSLSGLLNELEAKPGVDLFVFGCSKKPIFGLSNKRGIIGRILDAVPGRLANVCVSKDFLLSFSSEAEDVLDYEGRPFFLKLLLRSKNPDFFEQGFIRLVSRSEASPSVRNSVSDPLKRRSCRAAAVPSMIRVANEAGVDSTNLESLRELAKYYLAEEIENQGDFSTIVGMVESFRKDYIPLLGEDECLLESDVSELIYYCGHGDYVHAFQLAGALKAARLRKDIRVKDEALVYWRKRSSSLKSDLSKSKKEIKALKKQYKKELKDLKLQCSSSELRKETWIHKLSSALRGR